jgi:hypothetical protein
MATARSSPAVEIQEIQQRMAVVRRELHHDVREAVKGAQSLTDWRSLVRTHPWLTLATAAATGYLIVPKRRSESPAVVTVAVPPFPQSPAAPAPEDLPSAPRESRWGLIGTVLGLAAPVVIRAAQNYAAHYLEQVLAPHPGGGDRSGPSAYSAPHSSRDAR